MSTLVERGGERRQAMPPHAVIRDSDEIDERYGRRERWRHAGHATAIYDNMPPRYVMPLPRPAAVILALRVTFTPRRRLRHILSPSRVYQAAPRHVSLSRSADALCYATRGGRTELASRRSAARRAQEERYSMAARSAAQKRKTYAASVFCAMFRHVSRVAARLFAMLSLCFRRERARLRQQRYALLREMDPMRRRELRGC